jgi:hypothetical protein
MSGRLILVAAIAASAYGFATSPGGAAQSPICTRGQTDVQRDPRGLLPIVGVNPIAAATIAALRYEHIAGRPQVQRASFATADTERGPQAKYSCGSRVWRRTIVVYVLDRALLPAQSLAQHVYFVGRFRDGYHVWQVVH